MIFGAERLYLSSTQYGGNAFTNTVADMISQASETLNLLPDDNLVKTIFNKLPETSSLRRMMVDIYYYDADEKALCNAAARLPRAFLQDFMMMIPALRDEYEFYEAPHAMSLCNYYIHDEKTPSCAD